MTLKYETAIVAMLRNAHAPITSYALADAVLGRRAAGWEWWQIDATLCELVINDDDNSGTGRLRDDKGGRKCVYRWRASGTWLFCHVINKLAFAARDDDTEPRAWSALASAKDEVLGGSPLLVRGRPAKDRSASLAALESLVTGY